MKCVEWLCFRQRNDLDDTISLVYHLKWCGHFALHTISLRSFNNHKHKPYSTIQQQSGFRRILSSVNGRKRKGRGGFYKELIPNTIRGKGRKPGVLLRWIFCVNGRKLAYLLRQAIQCNAGATSDTVRAFGSLFF